MTQELRTCFNCGGNAGKNGYSLSLHPQEQYEESPICTKCLDEYVAFRSPKSHFLEYAHADGWRYIVPAPMWVVYRWYECATSLRLLHRELASL